MTAFKRRARRTEQDKLARDIAYKNGLHYYSGDVCPTCNTTLRSVKSSRCLQCKNLVSMNSRKKQEMKEKHGYIGEPIDIWRSKILSTSWKEPVCITLQK